MLIGLLVIGGGAIFYMISLYNKIIAIKEEGINSEKQISIQLDRRGKVFDSLINTVKKYMNYEQTTLKDVIELRQKSIMIKSDQSNVSNEGLKEVEQDISKLISSGKFSSSFNMTMEAYPDLKANENMLQLQEEIVSSENKLSFAKQSFNDSVERYKSTILSFPENIIVSQFPGLKFEFTYWELSKEKIKSKEEKVVNFD